VKIKSQIKNIQTDTSCTKLVVLCYILNILTKLELFVAFSKLNNQLFKF